MVLPDRIELSTSPLPMECSTTELRQHAGIGGIGPKGPHRRAVLATRTPLAQARGGAGDGPKWGKKMTPAAPYGGDPGPCPRHRRPEGALTPQSKPRRRRLPVP